MLEYYTENLHEEDDGETSPAHKKLAWIEDQLHKGNDIHLTNYASHIHLRNSTWKKWNEAGGKVIDVQPFTKGSPPHLMIRSGRNRWESVNFHNITAAPPRSRKKRHRMLP